MTNAPLLSVRGFAERRGVDEDPTDWKAVRALQDASDFVRQYTSQVITVVEDDSFDLDGPGRPGLLLPQVPVIEVCSVAILDAQGTAGDDLDETAYRVDRAGILWRMDGGVWTAGPANIRVVYDHGYAVVPGDLASACFSLAVENYNALATAGGVTSKQLGSFQVAYDAGAAGGDALDATVQKTLDRYRVPQ
jgi:hypothetical protein